MVNDGSTDYTKEILDELERKYERVGVIHHDGNKGYGGALRTGFAFIFSGPLIWLAVLSRADLSWAYPMLSLGYLFLVLISWFFLGEAFSLPRLVRTLFVCLGVLLIFQS